MSILMAVDILSVLTDYNCSMYKNRQVFTKNMLLKE